MKQLILAAAAVSLLALHAGAAKAGDNYGGQSYGRYCNHGSCAGERDRDRRSHADVRWHDRRDRYDGHGDPRFDDRRHDNDHWDNRRHVSFTWMHDRGHHYGWSRQPWHYRVDATNRAWNAHSNYDHPVFGR